MDMLIVTTESHRRLADRFFLPTLPTANGAVIRERRLDVVGEGDFDSESWQQGVTAKLGWALDYLGSVPDNASFVLSDVDIQFFPGFSTEALNDTFDRSGTDVLFQKEHSSSKSVLVNTGFYIARNTPWLRTLLADALALCADVKNDQTAINELLDADDLGTRWGFLPLAYYARTQGFPPPRDILLHHANFSGSVDEKISQMQRVRQYVTGNALQKATATAAEGWEYATSGKLRMWVRVKVKGR
jgi:hypothetical protein